MFKCECLNCGHIIESERHCKERFCGLCGGEMRRIDRPGIGA
jgi:Zn finger protein HypA/HybF involved in hydrogenase expression